MEIDYLIIGQGLAGSLLAWDLIQRNRKVIIVDNDQTNASKIAAGLINPITGMRFVKSNNVDIQHPFATNYYLQLSKYFQKEFYVKKDMLRILRDDKEKRLCKKRLGQIDYRGYLSEIKPSTYPINPDFSIIKQNKCGYLITPLLLSILREYFISKDSLIKCKFNYNHIIFKPTLHWENFHPGKIIFCEGYHALSNPWFSWLPFQPTKGEIITACSKNTLTQNILNYGHWFLPLDNYQFRTGATFNSTNLDTKITPEARNNLVSSLKKVYPSLTIDQLVKHQAGIRPNTLDKLPFLGSHPVNPNLVIFNGFGAKGSLHIPWYSQCLCDYLLYKHPLPNECNILRHSNYF